MVLLDNEAVFIFFHFLTAIILTILIFVLVIILLLFTVPNSFSWHVSQI